MEQYSCDCLNIIANVRGKRETYGRDLVSFQSFNNVNEDQFFSKTLLDVELGISGLPSFQVDDGPIVFGQDRLNIVEDMLLGWKFDIGDFFNKSKL